MVLASVVKLVILLMVRKILEFQMNKIQISRKIMYQNYNQIFI